MENSVYKNFGVLICCASNGVMKVERVKELIDILQKMGYTLLELCLDDMFKIPDEPYFGYLRGGYTGEEIREMDVYAKAKGIELVPAIQTLAHFKSLVKIPHYSDIVDIDDILLVDEPKRYELIEKMFATIAECFTSRKVNIGFDEAFKVGMGNYLNKHGYTNRFELLLRHLNRVVEIAGKYGFRIHMWSDMFFRLANHGEYWGKNIRVPENIREKVPEEVELCYWDYYSTDEAQYDHMLEVHEQFRRELWFAGGAWSWCGFAPHNHFSMKTMKPAMKQVRNHGIRNVLITVWGDDGHDCSYFSVLPSLYAIRQYADGNYRDEEIKEGFEKLFGWNFDDFLQLDLPNRNSKNEYYDKASNFCKSLLFNDCFLGLRDVAMEEMGHIPFAEYADALRGAAPKMGGYACLFENLAALCELLEIKAELGIRTRRAYQSGDRVALSGLLRDYEETDRRTEKFRNTLRAVWMKDNKPYGWDIQEMRLGALRARISDCLQRLKEYLAGDCERIPELEEKLLPYASWDSQFNSYCGFISVSEL